MMAAAKAIICDDPQQSVHLLSDGLLYQDALAFIETHGAIDGKTQLASLLNYTQSWEDLTKFVQHQSRRDWIGRKSYYGQYYAALDSYLKNLLKQAAEWFPAPDDASKSIRREQNETMALVLAREFIQHLAFENSYRERQR